MKTSHKQNNVIDIEKMMNIVDIHRKDDKDFNLDDPDYHPSDGDYNSNPCDNDESISDCWRLKRNSRSPDRSTKTARRNPGRSLDARGKSLKETNDKTPDFESSDDQLSEYEYDRRLDQCHNSSLKRTRGKSPTMVRRNPDPSRKRTRRSPDRNAIRKSLEETNKNNPDFESSDDQPNRLYDRDQGLEQCHISTAEMTRGNSPTTTWSSPDRSMKRTRRNPGRSLDARGKTLEETNNIYPGFESSDDDQQSDYVYNPHFEQCYICSPLSAINKEHLEDGNRIIMPQSALESLVNLNIDYPMMFEIKKRGSERVSHCGVLEFTAEEGFVCLPNWMMKNLDLQEGDIVTMKNVSLLKGASMKIQPHLTALINLPNAKGILEKGLKNYSCVTTGDTIVIPHNQARFFIDIVETKPTKAISVVETDCVVDFAPPLDYKEPEKKPKQASIQKKDFKKQDKEKAPFQPFSGRKNRLDGIVEEPDSSLLVDNMSIVAPKEPNLMNAQQKSLPKKFNVCPWEPSKTNSSSGKNVAQNSETEEKLFKAFTGKKYTLRG